MTTEDDKDLVAFVQFRLLTAGYSQALNRGDNYTEVQSKYMTDLEDFVTKYPKSADSAEAMLQLAMGEELSGDDKNALKWYERVKNNFSKTAAANKSEGGVAASNRSATAFRSKAKVSEAGRSTWLPSKAKPWC